MTETTNSTIIHREQVGPWYFAVREGKVTKGLYLAWCAKTPELGSGPMDICFKPSNGGPGYLDVHWKFDDDASEALRKLKQSVLS